MRTVTLSCLLLSSVACGGGSPSHEDGGADVWSTDASADVPPNPGTTIGDPCSRSDVNCLDLSATGIQGTCAPGQICMPETCGGMHTGFTGGYCMADCSNQPCPVGSVCVTVPELGASRCMLACTANTDCRDTEGYTCEGSSSTRYCANRPHSGAGTQLDGTACVTPPAQLPVAGFGASTMVPYGTGEVIDAEGNVATDGAGHVATSFIGRYYDSSAMWIVGEVGVASYTEGAGFAATSQVFVAPANSTNADPVVAYDTAVVPARLYATWITTSFADGTGAIEVAYSDANGAPGTWSAPIAISPATDWNLDKPWIVARAGNVFVTYTSFVTGGADVRVVRSIDAGKTWSPPINADLSPLAARNFAQPALDGAGDLWVVWFEQANNASTGTLVVGTLLAGASAFARNAVASGTLGPDYGDPSSIAVASDAGRIWVIFGDGTLAGGDVWSATSTDEGVSFAAPVKVNDDADPVCATHFHGGVALDGAGKAHVVWFDNRYLFGTVMYATSSDGAAFSANTVVGDAPFYFTTDRGGIAWLGDYLGVTASATKLYATWADPRSGFSHMYFASRPLP